jgi:hypothetical protein
LDSWRRAFTDGSSLTTEKGGGFTAPRIKWGGGEVSRIGRRRAAEPKREGASLHHEKSRGACFGWSGQLIRILSHNAKREFGVWGATMWVLQNTKAPKSQTFIKGRRADDYCTFEYLGIPARVGRPE